MSLNRRRRRRRRDCVHHQRDRRHCAPQPSSHCHHRHHSRQCCFRRRRPIASSCAPCRCLIVPWCSHGCTRESSEVIRGHQRSSEVIRGHQRSSEVIIVHHCDHQGSSAALTSRRRERRQFDGARQSRPFRPRRERGRRPRPWTPPLPSEARLSNRRRRSCLRLPRPLPPSNLAPVVGCGRRGEHLPASSSFAFQARTGTPPAASASAAASAVLPLTSTSSVCASAVSSTCMQ